MQINAHFLPTDRTPNDVANRTVVVIDVLRATTTIVTALANGAREVIPCLEIADAQDTAERCDNEAILGGERGGKPIPGFAVGNSPAEFTPQCVAGKTVVITTTNGTRAMQACRGAQRVLIGAFINLSRVVSALQRADQVTLLCAGTNESITREDVLFAGAVIAELRERRVAINSLNDEAAIACDAWVAAVGTPHDHVRLLAALTASRGGRNLVELGYAGDIQIAAQTDAHPLLPELFLNPWRILLSAD